MPGGLRRRGVTAWIVPDPCERPAAMREMLAASLPAAVDAQELVVAFTSDGEAIGASIWIDRTETPQDTGSPSGDDRLTRRLATVGSLTAARHPQVPHIHLASMGTVPNRRGLGAGTAMLRYGLDRARRLALPVYLERPRRSTASCTPGTASSTTARRCHCRREALCSNPCGSSLLTAVRAGADVPMSTGVAQSAARDEERKRRLLPRLTAVFHGEDER